jgi:hypothetical protein
LTTNEAIDYGKAVGNDMPARRQIFFAICYRMHRSAAGAEE